MANEAPAPVPSTRPRRRPYRWILDVLIAIILVVGISAYQQRHLLGTGERAPSFDLQALDGTRASLEDLAGKVVLLHFFATWCTVCRQEHAALNALNEQLAEDVAVLSVVVDTDDRAALQSYVQREALEYPVLLADEATLAAYRIRSYPTNYYLDRRGAIRGRSVGLSTRWAMRLRLMLARW
jgi:peroxiredoxin